MRPPDCEDETLIYRELFINIGNVKLSVVADKGLFASFPAPDESSCELHVHTYYEVFLVTSGHMQYKTSGLSVDLYENDFALVRPGIYHCTTARSGDTKRYSFGFTYTNGNPGAEDLYPLFERVFQGHTFEKRRNRLEIRSAFDRLYRYYSGSSPLKWQYTAACLHELILLILDALSSKPLVPDTDQSQGDNMLMRAYKIDAMVNKYFMYDISAAFIAKKLFLSEKQVNRIVLRQYGQTLGQKITALRMEVASRYLNETDMAVSEIAEKVGYSTLGGFYGAFRKHSGLTPGRYRKKRGASPPG